jgi:hypothetical protein
VIPRVTRPEVVPAEFPSPIAARIGGEKIAALGGFLLPGFTMEDAVVSGVRMGLTSWSRKSGHHST